MKVYVAALVVAGALIACTSGKPIYNVNSHALPQQAQNLSVDRVETLIIEAGQQKNWTFQRVARGKLRATQDQPKYAATVDVSFDNKAYSITHVSSRGMDEKDGTIHTHYNQWIRTLERDIWNRFAALPLDRGT